MRDTWNVNHSTRTKKHDMVCSNAVTNVEHRSHFAFWHVEHQTWNSQWIRNISSLVQGEAEGMWLCDFYSLYAAALNCVIISSDDCLSFVRRHQNSYIFMWSAKCQPSCLSLNMLKYSNIEEQRRDDFTAKNIEANTWSAARFCEISWCHLIKA